MKLSLFQKGLFVIAFVLAIQLVFLAFYGWLLSQSEFLNEQEYHNKSVIGRSNWVSALLFASNLAGFVHLITDDKDALNFSHSGKHAIAQEMQGLAEVLKENSDQDNRIKRSNELLNKTFALLDDATKNPGKLPEKERLSKLTRTELLPIWNELFNLRREMLAAEFAHYKINVESLPFARRLRDNAVRVFLIIDVLTAGGLLYCYTHGLTTRLAIMTDNARRFALKERLNKPVGGTDEITELDQTFHTMIDSLELANKRKQEFLSMISHDMRTPLSNVQASLEFVLEGHQEPVSKQTEEWLQRAYDNVDTVLNLINELLEIERIEGGALTLAYSEVQVSQLIRKSIDAVRAVAQQHDISIIEPHVESYLRCDEDRLIRVLVNLLGNAIKFSPRGSSIIIGCGKTMQWFELSIRDQGRGIPSELLDTVFERFKQVSVEDARKLGGSGLGLAISKAIVEAHEGMIKVESETEKGSVFRVLLPAANSTEID